MPLDAPNPSLLASDGSLPNHWKAVDAFHLNDSFLSVFHHHLYVPGDCVKPWALCLQKAAKTLRLRVSHSAFVAPSSGTLFFLNYFLGTCGGKRGSGNPLRYPSAAIYS